jgi:hypothetical protein
MENERLRAELSSKHSSHPRLALFLAALDVVLIVALRPWLNGMNDVHFWAALSSVAMLGVGATLAALGRRRAVR